MRILIAPNTFKNSLSATEVALAIKDGFEQSSLQCQLECFPIGDGGDGTAELLLEHYHGSLIETQVKDPLGRSISSSFGWIQAERTAIVEMAKASGLKLLKADEFNPLLASSFGTGQLIIEAQQKGAAKIILCIGGSATVDGGTGILRALGFKFLDENEKELPLAPESLKTLERIEFSAVNDTLQDLELIVLCDVINPLLGPHGSAAVFGPQKGATPDEVKKLENSLSRFRDIVLRQTGVDMAEIKHGGAAGGVAAGLAALLNAQLVNGIDYFLSFTNFEKSLVKADLVVTGEGSIDIQTLDGKGPYGVAKKAKELQKPVIGLAGSVPTEKSDMLMRFFDVLLSINEQPVELSVAIADTKKNLVRMSKNIGNILALDKKALDSLAI